MNSSNSVTINTMADAEVIKNGLTTGEQNGSNGTIKTEQSSDTSNITNFIDYENYLTEFEEESKFQKHGKKIAEMLKWELQLIKLKTAPVKTRLYEYQIEAVLKTAQHFQSISGSTHQQEEEEDQNQHPICPALISAPPGSGKSGMVTLLPYVMSSKKVLIVTPSRVISDQIADAFGHPTLTNAFFFKSGMFLKPKALKNIMEVPHIARNPEEVNTMTCHNLVIVNAQKFTGNSTNSLNNPKNPEASKVMRDKLNEFDTIIVDEAHHYPAKTWQNIVNCFHGKKIVFLTATPFRGYGGKIVHMTDSSLGLRMEEVYNIRRDLLEGSTIRKLEFIQKPMPASNSEDKQSVISGPEYILQLKEDIQDILDKHKRMEPRLESPQAILVVRTKFEARDIATALGPSATFVISGKEGIANLDQFTKGIKQSAVVCGMLREGYDNPNVTLCVILLKCQSRVFFEQFCGRCMRMNRNLTGKWADKTVGTVLSYEHFQQKKLWDAREVIADEDPCDETSESDEDPCDETSESDEDPCDGESEEEDLLDE